MIKDSVVVGDGYNWTESSGKKTMAYMPKIDSNGAWMSLDGKSVVVESAGGVVCGSRGVIKGDVIKVSRDLIPGAGKSYSANDFVELVPVYLERYKRIGYFLVDHIRVLSD